MKSLVGYLVLVGFVFTAACQTPGSPAPAGVAPSPDVMKTVEASGSTPLATQTTAPLSSSVGPTATMSPPVAWNGDGPLFVAVIQTTGMGGDSAEKPTIDVGLVAFAYDLDNKILMLHPTIPAASLAADYVVGLISEVETPTAIYIKREILRSPSEPRFIKILGPDAGSDTLSFTYDGQTYSLQPGQSLSFDKTGTTPSAATFTTLITNHGRLEGAQTMPPSGPQP